MNYPEFRAAIARAGVTNRELARSLGLSEQAFYNKANGQTEFKNSEIKKLSVLLHLSMDAVNQIFFDAEVNKIHDCGETMTSHERAQAQQDSA